MYWYPFFRLDLAWNFSAFPIGETRIFGVLQRIALAYGVAAALLHFAGKKWTYALVLLSLPVYWFLLATYGIEGLDPLSLEGNAVRALDLKLIGANHMYMGEGIAFDPEGLLTTLPSIANIVAGYAAGLFVQRERDEKNTRIDLMLLGASLCLVALVWNLAFPINKKLWTSSYVLLTIGLDLVILGLLMWFLPKDKKLPGWGTFFQTAGKNPLAIYLLSELALITLYTLPAGTSSAWEWAYTNGFSWMGAKLGSFAMAAVFSLSCWAFGYWMDRRKWYWRV
jgi:predicted acyltransferase